MSGLHDILLPLPIAEVIARGLLFAAFVLHLLFVLMMLGTGILAVAYFIHAWWGGEFRGAAGHTAVSEMRWDKRVLRMFLIHKGMAVVLGIGPLLLIQVVFTIPFFTALTIFAPFWLVIIACLIAASLSFDALGHKIYVHHYLHLVIGLLAIIALLAIPGFFVAVLVSAENSDRWLRIISGEFALDPRLVIHWLLRYLHVLGAAIVFASAFHYFFTARNHVVRRRSLVRWMLAGLLAQVAIGIGLFLSLLQEPMLSTYVYLFIGAMLAAVLIGLGGFHAGGASMRPKVVVPGLAVLLVSMLLIRQGFQDRAFGALIPQVRQNAEEYRQKLAAHAEQAVKQYKEHIQLVYDNGVTIYEQSCSFCHGANGLGDGPDAHYLSVPPEHLAAVRSTKAYLLRRVSEGVPGSGMPYFSYFSPPKLDKVIAYLNKTWGVLAEPIPVGAQVSEADIAAAAKEYKAACAQCHGMDGRDLTDVSRGLKPRPPDLAAFSLQPEWAFRVITNGYQGTAMSGYGHLSEAVRWGLVGAVQEKRMKGSGVARSSARKVSP